MHLQKEEIQVVSDSINMLASVMTKIKYSPFKARDGLVIGSTVTFPTLPCHFIFKVNIRRFYWWSVHLFLMLECFLLSQLWLALLGNMRCI